MVFFLMLIWDFPGDLLSLPTTIAQWAALQKLNGTLLWYALCYG
jgi:hypothetical protein